VLLGSVTLVTGLVGLAIGTAAGSVPVAGAGLVLIGVGNSTWDVAQNVEGADVERRSDGPSCPDSTPASASARWRVRASAPAPRRWVCPADPAVRHCRRWPPPRWS
jgi:hypothetical protein